MIDIIDLKEYEAMAMLDLPDDEREKLGKRYDEIVGGFSALERIDTNSLEPLVTVLDMNSIMREDVSVKFLTRDAILANAPEQYDGYFQVPGTLV